MKAQKGMDIYIYGKIHPILIEQAVLNKLDDKLIGLSNLPFILFQDQLLYPMIMSLL